VYDHHVQGEVERDFRERKGERAREREKGRFKDRDRERERERVRTIASERENKCFRRERGIVRKRARERCESARQGNERERGSEIDR